MALALIVIGFVGAYSYWEPTTSIAAFDGRLPAARTQGRLLDVNFYSRALSAQADYLAYLPPGYAPRASATPSTTCCTAARAARRST